MQRYKLHLFSFLIILLFCTPFIYAQEKTSPETKVYQIILYDGTRLIGTIEKEDETTVYFKTRANIPIEIPRNQIRSKKLLSGKMIGGKYLREDPNHTRLFFAPTARALKSGQGYFSAYEIFFPFVAIGVTDFISLAGGVSLFPFTTNQLVYFAPKVRFLHLQNFDLAGGLLYMNVPGSDFEGAGLVYSVATYGTPRLGITLGLAYGFSGEGVSNEPVFMIGGEYQISNNVKFITENWFPPEANGALLSLGIRFFGEHLAADFALVHPTGADTEGFPFFPWLGFAYNFGID